MFVLSNAWRALTRSKGRTALTAFITLAVTFGTVAGLAIIQEDTNAHTTAYDQQKATLAIRPTAATWKKVSATPPQQRFPEVAASRSRSSSPRKSPTSPAI